MSIAPPVPNLEQTAQEAATTNGQANGHSTPPQSTVEFEGTRFLKAPEEIAWIVSHYPQCLKALPDFQPPAQPHGYVISAARSAWNNKRRNFPDDVLRECDALPQDVNIRAARLLINEKHPEIECTPQRVRTLLASMGIEVPDEASKKKQAARAKKEAKFEAAGKPIIETHDRPLPDILSDLGRALALHNGTEPTVFFGVNGLCEIGHSADGAALLEDIGRERLQVIAANCATWKATTDSKIPREITPPAALCQQFLVSRDVWKNIPPIKRILTAPFVDRDGKICASHGYHRKEQIWLSLPPCFALPDTTPTAENIEAAKALLIARILGEVAFADDANASRANALGLMLLMFMRSYIAALKDGQTPNHLFDAPAQSSGKTYAATICMAPFCEVSPTSDKKDEKESAKEIFALLLEGWPYIFVDNVKGAMGSSEIATAITSGRMRGRVLGKTGTRTVDANIVWVSTSNNAQLDADIVSRSILIRLDTNSEAPEEHKFAFNPLRYIAEHRAEVQGAILTLIRAWLEAGRPDRKKKVSRFPAWERTIGGILETVGVDGFLENHKDARDSADPETVAWRGFVLAWNAEHADNFKTVQQIWGIPEIDDFKALVGEKEPIKVLGKELQKRKDRVINGFKITRDPERGRVNRWKVVKVLGNP